MIFRFLFDDGFILGLLTAGVVASVLGAPLIGLGIATASAVLFVSVFISERLVP